MVKKREIGKQFSKGDFRVAIFGSARIKKNDSVYKHVYSIGKLLGEKDIDLVTGGGPGLMEAANGGHKAGSKITGARSIGLNIKLPREQKVNKHLDVKKEFATFSERLDIFMRLSNAVIVAPGGVGTMLELFYAWQLVQVSQICNIPIILLGDVWKGLAEWLKKEPLRKRYFNKKDFDMLFFAKNSKEAIDIIEGALGEFNKGGKNFCINYKKYRID
jgi:uncharacterized protein (TIGR00730 family)